MTSTELLLFLDSDGRQLLTFSEYLENSIDHKEDVSCSLDAPMLAVASSGRHFGLLRRNGQLFTWGQASSGQLGHGAMHELSSPCSISSLERQPGVQIAMEGGQSAMVTEEGRLVHWGWNGTEKPISIPQILNVEAVKQVALGGFHGLCLVDHSASIRSSSLLTGWEVMSWGMNEHGQLGVMDEEKRMQPVVIPTLRTKGIVRVFAGMRTSFALSEKGEVYCWGSAKSGELGLGIETGFLATPRRNRHLSDIKDLQVGRGFVIALTYGGLLFSWGANQYGQLGHGDDKMRLVPSRITGIVPMERIFVCKTTCFAITKNEEIYRWGGTTRGEATAKPERFTLCYPDGLNCWRVRQLVSYEHSFLLLADRVEPRASQQSTIDVSLRDDMGNVLHLSVNPQETVSDLYRYVEQHLHLPREAFIIVKRWQVHHGSPLSQVLSLRRLLGELDQIEHSLSEQSGAHSPQIVVSNFSSTERILSFPQLMNRQIEVAQAEFHRRQSSMDLGDSDSEKSDACSVGSMTEALKPAASVGMAHDDTRRVLQSGYLRKQRKGTQWKKRWVTLTPRAWAYYKTAADAVPLRTIRFQENDLVVAMGTSKRGEARIHLHTEHGHFIFQFESVALQQTWAHSLRHALMLHRMIDAGDTQPERTKRLKNVAFTNLLHQREALLLWLDCVLRPHVSPNKRTPMEREVPVLSHVLRPEILALLRQHIIEGSKPLAAASAEDPLYDIGDWRDAWHQSPGNPLSLGDEQVDSILQELSTWRSLGCREFEPELIVQLLRGNETALRTFLWEAALLYYQARESFISNCSLHEDPLVVFQTVRDAALLWVSTMYEEFFGIYLNFRSLECVCDGVVFSSVLQLIGLLDLRTCKEIGLTGILDMIYMHLDVPPVLSEDHFRYSMDERTVILFLLAVARGVSLRRPQPVHVHAIPSPVVQGSRSITPRSWDLEVRWVQSPDRVPNTVHFTQRSISYGALMDTLREQIDDMPTRFAVFGVPSLLPNEPFTEQTCLPNGEPFRIESALWTQNQTPSVDIRLNTDDPTHSPSLNRRDFPRNRPSPTPSRAAFTLGSHR